MAVLGPRFDCCRKVQCERENTTFAQWILPDGEESTVCPAQLVDAQTWQLFDWYAHYKNGVLPVGGGLLDQTVFYAEAMTAIERAINAAQSKSKI